MKDTDIITFDDILPLDIHQKLYKDIKREYMTNEWSSVGNKETAWHWNYVFHNSKQYMPAMDRAEYEILKGKHPHVADLWDHISQAAKSSVGALKPLRIYMNCNPYGTNGYIHRDDGDMTAIYYPCTNWLPEWEGGTCFYEKNNGIHDAVKYVSYRPNRLILFRAQIPHRAMPVDRVCIIPRYVIAMKLQFDVSDPDYVKRFYNEKRS
jgi:hypothetical protein